MSEFVLSFLVLSRLAGNPETHRFLLWITWPMRVHDVLVFSGHAENGESSEFPKTFIMNYLSPIVDSDLLILCWNPRG